MSRTRTPMRAATPALLALLAAASPASAIVKCRTADGKLIFADSPPAGCTVEGEFKSAPAPAASGYLEPTPSSSGASSSAAEDGAAMIRERLERRAAQAEHRAEMARRKKLPAVEFVETFDRRYGNGRFLEGTVANSAEFPVYNVTVCVNGNCRRVAPSTLQPGSQGKYAFPATQDWRRSGEMTVEWDVEP